MAVLENVKRAAERATGWSRPSADDLARLVRKRKPVALRFKDEGLVPNHPRWPLVIYRGALRLPADFDPAAVFEDLFAQSGWGDSWRDGIYDYLHYHSRIHEVLGVARGSAEVRFGGALGRTVKLRAGDVAILPAGTGHQLIAANDDFLVVGAYPPTGRYDECKTAQDRKRALKTVPKVPPPRKDPVCGSDGPLLRLWKKQTKASTRNARRVG